MLHLESDPGAETAGLLVESDPEFKHSNPHLSSSHNRLKLSISLVQAIWATITVYRARGDQVQQYGYAAFSLTVAPYAFMSVMNLVANLVTPEYPALFVIRTPILKQAEDERKAFFKGAIHAGWQESHGWPGPSPTTPLVRREWSTINVLRLGILLNFVPLAVVGGLSGFQPGNSTQTERGFTMSWLVIGMIYGMYFGFVPVPRLSRRQGFDSEGPVELFAFISILAVPAVGGMVVVGRMIRDFGVCTLVS
jgi:hypothetical protein